MRAADLVYRQVRRHVRRRTLDLLIMDGPARSCFHSESRALVSRKRAWFGANRARAWRRKRGTCDEGVSEFKQVSGDGDGLIETDS